MKSEIELQYQIAIGLLPGIGPVTAKTIIAYTGSIEGAFKEKKAALLKIPGIGEITAKQIIAGRDVLSIAEKEVRFIQNKGIQTRFFLDEDYPFLLKQIPDSPIMLFFKGNISHSDSKIISIVGTRNATNEGKLICEKLVREFAENGFNPIIVSGLAFGIDICAHKAALKNDLRTFAVLGHGLDRIYPAEHASVAREIEGNGALITEFLHQSPFERQNFLRRNRIIAAIAEAVIVVESGEKGGSLVTAEIASSYNRDVLAFPGRVSDKQSAGCNALIKRNKAALIESCSDVEYALGWEKNKDKKAKQKTLFFDLNEEEKKVVDTLKMNVNCDIDALCTILEIQQGKLSNLLLELEFKGAVRCLPGKIYQAV